MIHTIYGYVAIKQLEDNGEKGIVESGKSTMHLKNGESTYSAPKKCVIVGRKHVGDENGYTYYMAGIPEIVFKDSSLNSSDLKVEMEDRIPTDSFKQSDCSFVCNDFSAITGRTHTGDENGKTSFVQAKLYLSGSKADSYELVKSDEFTGDIDIEAESNVKWATKQYEGYYMPMTEMGHKGDENAPTHYSFTQWLIKKKG